jgi:heat shock protein HtpX
MPITFIDIERQKNWRIALFFLVLMAVYLAAAALFGLAFLPGPLWATPRFWIFLGLAAFCAAGVHFWFSASAAVDTVVQRLDARPPDPNDDIHHAFMNILEELRVVTGSQRAIQGMVVPSLSLNALAAADLKGNALIAITEGLLSRLSRSQIEAVVCHEAHHVLSGDCLETTVAASIFGTFSTAFDKIRYSSQRRAFASPALLLAWVLLQLGYLLNLFISREREYRADAASVRMTRNPLALAETLHLLSRSWRGAGFIGSGFEMLCIVNPQVTALDEAEGFVSDLLSTHPPIRRRMEILLRMARVSVSELDARAAKQQQISAPGLPEPSYYAMSPRQQWQGPFTVQELAVLPWLTPLTWVTAGQGESVDRAWKDPHIDPVFAARLAGNDRVTSNLICPLCKQPLVTMSYEGTRTYRCSFCAGTLVENSRIPRIIARTGKGLPCSERVNALAKATLNQNQSRFARQKLVRHEQADVPRLPCPKCGNPMLRRFYSMAHLIEVDRCSNCEITWFDQDELEMLQCMIENRIAPDPAAAEAAMAFASLVSRRFPE